MLILIPMLILILSQASGQTDTVTKSYTTTDMTLVLLATIESSLLVHARREDASAGD